MNNKLINGLGAIAISTMALANSGCQMCGEPAYYDDYATCPSYYQQAPYYQPAPCFQQPQYFQQIPCQQIYNRNQASSPVTIHNGNGINSALVKTEQKTEPAAQPPKPVPEEIPAPQPMQPSNLKSFKTIK